MGTGYTRNDTANNIASGNVISAADLDGEFDAIEDAFDASTGHSHDGTAGEGPQITDSGIADNAVALGTKTTGNYVATVASGNSAITVSGSGSETAAVTVSHADTSSQASVNNSGNSFIQDVTLDTFGHVTGLSTGTVVIPDTANDATITLAAGTALSGGGSFTTDQATNETITFNANDASTTGKGVAQFNGTDFAVTSGVVTLNKDPSITLTGNVTGSGTMTNLGNVSFATTIANDSVALGTKTTGNYVATVASGNSGISVSGSGSETAAVTVSHADTSSQASVNNSGSTFIQDITLDTFGHITAIGSATVPDSSPSASEILTLLKTVDGSGSGLDADLLDGVQASSFAQFSANVFTTTNGYLRFSNNFMIQWGVAIAIADFQTKTHTFAYAFPNACCSVMTQNDDSTDQNWMDNMRVENYTRTSFRMYRRGNNTTVRFLALGY